MRPSVFLAGMAVLAPALAASDGDDPGVSSCVACHGEIESMHPEAQLSCTDCHGGDDRASTLQEAHVPASRREASDERVAPLDRDLARRRFVNPMDLRVAEDVCGDCHQDTVEHVLVSLHGTTAGHLSDGFYEMGLFEERGSRFSVFPVDGAPRTGGEVEKLVQIPEHDESSADASDLRSHYTDLARKECMQCHLWSEGRAVRGRVGFDGDYRGEGCAACHVPYAIDGLSRSGDFSIPKGEPGHPRLHSMTRAPETSTCTSCHYGDASIGLHFRGLSQLPPGAPGGPDIPGTTDTPLNRTFYLSDPDITPPDVHHERGMHCIDCHTANDVMGDGKLHGQMEHAVEISCSDCHGTFTEPSTLRTERGTPLEHLRREGEQVILTSKVTGEEHPVPQVVHVLDPDRREYNARAAEAMTDRHSNIECYTCHAGWNVNFLGFHFTRNESLSQLDLVSGKRTPGRVTTQEKVFTTWKSFYAGLNDRGAIAPYLTGFSTMGSVFDEDGELVLDQVMPVTAAGLSGMTMIHHQLHSTRPTARSCVECHRSSATWGLGSPNFRLARNLVFAADRRGIEVVALRRERLSDSVPLAKLPLPDVVDLELVCDDLQGHARTLFAAEGGRGIHVVDVTDPTDPRKVAFAACIQPRGMELIGDHLLVADGIGGLRVFDVSEPSEIRPVGRVPMFDAHDVTVSWPWAFVADGPGGLAIVDISVPIAPRFITAIDVNGPSKLPNDVTRVATLFQYSRPTSRNGEPSDRRTRARNLCAVLDQEMGLVLIDVTEPVAAEILSPRFDDRSEAIPDNVSFRGLWLASHVDLAESQGGGRTVERDYAYLLREVTRGDGDRRSALAVIDITRPDRPRYTGAAEAGYATEDLTPLALYTQPFLETVFLASGSLGVFVTNASVSAEPAQVGTLPAMRNVYATVAEEFPLDRMIDESGRRLKDVSHSGSRWLYRSELERILTVPGVDIGKPPGSLPVLGGSARAHLAGFDVDGSGLLEGEEIERASAASLDADGDGRIAMIELARTVGLLTSGLSEAVVVESVIGESRRSRDGDLARLLDGVNPFEFDRNRDRQLAREEVEDAFFAALDLSADGRLSPAEFSRYPGETRELRYEDELARRVLAPYDDNSDGRISRREFDLGDEVWSILDENERGFLVLPGTAVERADIERGNVGPNSDWPVRRVPVIALPPVCTVEGLLEVLDENGDGELSRRELRRRPELLRDLDRNGDGGVGPEELQRAVDLVTTVGVDLVSDGYRHRWDIDGDGRVESGEIPGWAWRLTARPSDR